MALITDPSAFLYLFNAKPAAEDLRTTAMREALLIGPEYFEISSQSASDNLYMTPNQPVNRLKAMEQHEALKSKLESFGIPVTVFPGLPGQHDAVFPNNAFATVRGRAIIGKMRHPVRQEETLRADVRNWLRDGLKYDLSDLSESPGVAELTGVLVIDRSRNIGFCGLSGRADETGAQKMHDAFKLHSTFTFRLAEGEYHTNVVFAVLAGRAAVLYPGGLASPSTAKAIVEAYGSGAVVISKTEKDAFVANCLAITHSDVLFSSTAHKALSKGTKKSLEEIGFSIHHVDVSEFEKAGGSLRCLIAEIY